MAFLIEDEEIKEAVKMAMYDIFCNFVKEVKEEYDVFKDTLAVHTTIFNKSNKAKKSEIFAEVERLYIDHKISFENHVASANGFSGDGFCEKDIENFKKGMSKLKGIFKQYKLDLQELEDKISKIDPKISQKVEQEKARIEELKRSYSSSKSSSDDGDWYHSHHDSGSSSSGGMFGWGIGSY